MNILITGGTGFIGKKLVRSLVSQGETIYILVRPQSLDEAKETFKDLKSVHYISGNIETTDVLTDLTSVSNVIEKMDSVIHLAALYDLTASFKDSYLLNIIGTQNIINLIRKMKNVKYLHYFSTYAVYPESSGSVDEDYLASDDAKFNDNYAKTKNYAEHLVRKRIPEGVNLVIHRPGIIIGDSIHGTREKDDGPYYFFKFIQKIKNKSPISKEIPFLPLPVLKSSQLPVLPVDTLVHWCTQIIIKPIDRKITCYHLIPKREILTKDFLELSMKLMDFPAKIISVTKTSLFSPIFQLIQFPKELIFYMSQDAHFSRSNLEADFPELSEPQYEDYLPIIIDEFLRHTK